jgi:tRNA 2-thiouridine synthesizing protein A
LDGGDRRCVQLLIELRRLVADLAPGAVVHLVTTDPAAPIDLPAWCHLTGHTYLGPVPGDAAVTRPAREPAPLPGPPAHAPDTARPATYALVVQPAVLATRPDAPWHTGRPHENP